MNVKECIAKRRSIRKFRQEDVSDEIIYDLLDCARLAPSACNAQPWRFKIVRDKDTKQLLSQISFNQKHIAEAPVVLVCCGNAREYVSDSQYGSEELYNLDIINKDFYSLISHRTTGLKDIPPERLSPEVSFNVAMAIEHIALRAVELGLGSCWVKIADERKIRELFNWDENIRYVSLLALGYPAEEPKPIKKLSIEDILL